MELIINNKDNLVSIKDLRPGSCFYDQVTDNFYILSSTEWLATNLENGDTESYNSDDLIIPVKGKAIIEADNGSSKILLASARVRPITAKILVD